ncbi:Uncharacterised protein [Shigella sonnei]|nr:Uncharacterised protein [Shigella sonnei]
MLIRAVIERPPQHHPQHRQDASEHKCTLPAE